MASLCVLTFDHDGRPIQFDTWLEDLQLYLLSDSSDNVLLFDHTSGASLAPAAPAYSTTRSQWLTCDAAACFAVRNHLPLAKHAHFGQHKTAKALYNAVVARYSSRATAALGRLILPYLFLELSAFATVEGLVAHLRTSDARYRAALPAEFLDRNPPPMYITLYFIVTRLPDSLRAVRDHFLTLDPTDLTVDVLEKQLLAAETSVVAVGAARGSPRTPFLEGSSPSPLAPSYAFAAAVDILGAEDVGVASALSGKRRSSKGKGGKSGGGGSQGGGGGGGSGGGGGGGGGGSGGSGGGSGGFGGGGGGSDGGGGGGGGGSGSGGSGSGGGRGGAVQRGAMRYLPGATAAEGMGEEKCMDAFGIAIDQHSLRWLVGEMRKGPVGRGGKAEKEQGRCSKQAAYAAIGKLTEGKETVTIPSGGKEAEPGKDLELGADIGERAEEAIREVLQLHRGTFAYNLQELGRYKRRELELNLTTKLDGVDGLYEYNVSVAPSALVAELLGFVAACRLDYATALVAKSTSASPPSVGGEYALGTDVLEDRQEDFECLAAAVPCFASMLLAPEGDPDAPDIPTPRSYAEVITGPYSSQWQAAMDAEMASWKSTGTYVDEVPVGATLRFAFGLLSVCVHACVHGMGEPDEVLGCPTCMQAKFTRYPFSSLEATAKAPLDEVVMDVVGPLKLGAAGAESFLTIVDVYTRMTWVYVLSKKSDVAETVKTDWLPMVERQQDRLVKAIRTDRGGEFLSKEFSLWLKKNGIRHSLTIPYSPAMNGIAGQANRTITETARGLLIEAGLPDYFWPDAVRSACVAKNRALTHVGADKWVPYVDWIGRKPKVDMLRVFGCMCMALVPKHLRHNKLGAKAIWAVHLGMAQNSKGWLLWDPFTKKFLVSRDCRFMENLMYKDWKAENEAKIGMWFGEVKSSGLEHVELPLELSNGSTTTRQSSLVNGGEEAKDAEEEEEEVQQVSERAPTLPSRTTSAPRIRVTPQQRQGLHVPAAEEEGRGKRRIQAPNRLTYDALGKPAKSALARVALIVGDDEESDYKECAFVFFSPVEMPWEPATLKEALESSDAEEWKKAMESELKSIEENDTWELVELLEGRKAITSKWLFKIKSDADGNMDRYKSRLVAKDSSCEAEIYAGAITAQELRWFTYLLTDLGEQPHSLPVLYVCCTTLRIRLSPQRPVPVVSGGAGDAAAEGGDTRAAGPGGAGSGGAGGVRVESFPVEDTTVSTWQPRPALPSGFPPVPQFPPRSSLRLVAVEPGGVATGGNGDTGGMAAGGSVSRATAAVAGAASVAASGEGREGATTAAGESGGGVTAAAAGAVAATAGESRGGVMAAATGAVAAKAGENRGVTAAAGEGSAGFPVAAAGATAPAIGEGRGGATGAIAGTDAVTAVTRGGSAKATALLCQSGLGTLGFILEAAKEVEMASYRSTRTYVNAVPPPRTNVVNGMWLYKMKRQPESPPVFKARYWARGFSQRKGVDFFQTFAPIPKTTTLRVLLHITAWRDYELHSLDFFTAFLQRSLHEQIRLRRQHGFTVSFPLVTQWQLRRPVYGLRQAPGEWHDTLRTTLVVLDFFPSSADLSLFVSRGSTPFFVLAYVVDLVFATPDRHALASMKEELQRRHTCTDLGDATQRYFGLQILTRFCFPFSKVQLTPLVVDHGLTAPHLDEPFVSYGPYLELVGCLMYMMTYTCPDIAYPLSVLAHFVAPGRHRPSHSYAAKMVAKYVASTSGMGLVLRGKQPVTLTGFSDSSWADDTELLRCEAEVYTVAMAAQELRWLSFLLTDLGERPRSPPVLFADNKYVVLLCEEPRLAGKAKHIQLRYFLLRELQQRGQALELRWLTYLLTDFGEAPHSPPVLYVDNKAMLAFCQEHRLEHRTKHISLCYFLARELQQRCQLRLAYVASQANTADVFTKALPRCDHQPCFAFLDWSCDLLFSPTLPMGFIHSFVNSLTRPVVSRVLSALVTHPTAPLSSVLALVTTVPGFASSHRLVYAAHLVFGPYRSPLSRGAPVYPLEVLQDTLDFFPLSADPTLFVHCGSTPFFVLVYVNDLVFATPDRHALASVKEELQRRHTCTGLGELQRYLGLHITWDRAARTITLTQSHLVEQILTQFFFPFSKVQPTPLAVDHGLTAPPSNKPFESSDPYPELVGCLMYLMTCTRPDLAYPLSVLARFVALRRHRPSHKYAAKRVAKYVASTSGMELVLGGK
ncbi:unnamed protein product [Closterium sp. NIES-53]